MSYDITLQQHRVVFLYSYIIIYLHCIYYHIYTHILSHILTLPCTLWLHTCWTFHIIQVSLLKSQIHVDFSRLFSLFSGALLLFVKYMLLCSKLLCSHCICAQLCLGAKGNLCEPRSGTCESHSSDDIRQMPMFFLPRYSMCVLRWVCVWGGGNLFTAPLMLRSVSPLNRGKKDSSSTSWWSESAPH